MSISSQDKKYDPCNSRNHHKHLLNIYLRNFTIIFLHTIPMSLMDFCYLQIVWRRTHLKYLFILFTLKGAQCMSWYIISTTPFTSLRYSKRFYDSGKQFFFFFVQTTEKFTGMLLACHAMFFFQQISFYCLLWSYVFYGKNISILFR